MGYPVRSIQIAIAGHVGKLEPRFVGPYEIIKPVGLDTYIIKLPTNSRAHPVFHTEYLKPYYVTQANLTQNSSLSSDEDREC